MGGETNDGGAAFSVTRLWVTFVLGWLLVLGVSAALLVQQQPGPEKLVPALILLALLGSVYLWLTLRGALTPADLAPEGPDPSDLRFRLLCVGAMAGLVLALVLLIPGGGLWWLVMHPIVAACLALPPVWAASTGSVLLVLALLGSYATNGQFEGMLLTQIAFGAGAISVRQLTVTVAQLRAARQELARRAVNEERLRFARDLHDLLGHSLSMVVLKSELAGRLLPAAPDRAAREVTDIEQVAREALSEVRTAIAGYRQPTLTGELSAARELLAAAGIEVHVDQQVSALPPDLDGLLAWAIREGITNVIRHSRATHAAIQVTRHDGKLVARISDDGNAGRPFVHGNGLTGLAERAAALGGSLKAGPEPAGGFLLSIEVPERHT